MRAFILAGGFATRLWPLTEKRAKPLLPLAGKPMLTHILDGIPADVGVTVSTNAAFEAGFEGWRQSVERDVEIVIEETRSDDEKLGALGAVRQWIETARIDEDVLLLTGDNYFGFPMPEFIAAARPGAALVAAHDLRDIARASAFGTVIVADDKRTVVGFEEKPEHPKTSLVSTGCSLLPRDTLPILCEHSRAHPDNVGGIFEELLRRGKEVDAFVFTQPWFDVGSFQAYLEATRALVGQHCLAGFGAEIDDTTVEGSVVLGTGSTVRGGSLEDVVLFENCTVEDCVLRDCILDDNCVLKGVDLTGKMLRAGTVLTRTSHSGPIA